MQNNNLTKSKTNHRIWIKSQNVCSRKFNRLVFQKRK
jgi:hypothetical protein